MVLLLSQEGGHNQTPGKGGSPREAAAFHRD